jgi:hypothetical protein
MEPVESAEELAPEGDDQAVAPEEVPEELAAADEADAPDEG